MTPTKHIHPTAEVVNSIVGPHVSLGAGCRVERSILSNSILEDEAQVLDVILETHREYLPQFFK